MRLEITQEEAETLHDLVETVLFQQRKHACSQERLPSMKTLEDVEMLRALREKLGNLVRYQGGYCP